MLVRERVKKVLGAVLGIDPASVRDDTSPSSVEQWDSLRHMNLVVALEEEFDIRFPDESISEIVSLKLISDRVEGLLPKRSDNESRSE